MDRTEGIAGLVAAWTSAWNAHDMSAASALVDPDVEFVTVAGKWLRGRDEFLGHHDTIHTRQMRDSRWATRGYNVRWLRDGLALVHVEWTIDGDRNADDTPRSPRSGTFTWLVADIHGACRIVAAHNTNLRDDVSHRLSRHEAKS